MKVVTEFLSNINVCYMVVNILLLIDIYVYLKQKQIKPLKGRIILLGGFVVSAILFNYLNGIFNVVLDLKYLSIKSFLLQIIIVIGISLFTINKPTKMIYSILNYILSILTAIIVLTIIAILIGNKYPQVYLMDSSNIVMLIDLSLVIFILYLIIISLIYIGYYVLSNTNTLEIKLSLPDKKDITIFKKKYSSKEELPATILTDEQLLNYKDKHNFHINGVECSIIFEDSNKDNIIKNYHILLEDINAKMVNGFTLEENRLLKSICNKLKIYKLENINLNNLNILSQVTVEEYNFLKKII